MANNFDPYHQWLGISQKDQPPNHYRLLGIDLFESDPDAISNAADQRMTHIRSFQAGQHVAESQKILNEIAAARICLLNPEKNGLRRWLAGHGHARVGRDKVYGSRNPNSRYWTS